MWEARAIELAAWFTQHGSAPLRTGVEEEKRLAGYLMALRANHQDVLARHPQVPLRARPDDFIHSQCLTILAWCDLHGSMPSTRSRDTSEKRLANTLKNIKERHSAILALYPRLLVPASKSDAIRRFHGKQQFTSLGALMTLLARSHGSIADSKTVGPESGRTLRGALFNAHNKPASSRGLGYAPDLCQVNTFTRAKTELEHGCWRVTLAGQAKPDPRPWAAILASGDNGKIETAERIAFLDWENPDAAGKPVRRPWSPPATQPEAGKPAPAKGKGKHARAEG